MPRSDFVQSVVPLSEKEHHVLEQRIDAATRHTTSSPATRPLAPPPSTIAPNMTSRSSPRALPPRSPSQAHRTVTKDTKRVPVVEAVLDPLSRADSRLHRARARSQRRVRVDSLHISESAGRPRAVVPRDAQRSRCACCWTRICSSSTRATRPRHRASFHFGRQHKFSGDRVDWCAGALRWLLHASRDIRSSASARRSSEGSRVRRARQPPGYHRSRAPDEDAPRRSPP